MNLKELKEIFRLVEKTDFSEVEISRESWSLKISRSKSGEVQTVPGQIMQPVMQYSNGLAEQSVQPVEDTKAATIQPPKEEGNIITSPFVGTFYLSPSPDSEPYVALNQSIQKGQVMCIVEAMKLMNELESEVSGKLLEIYPQDGQAVEFGEKLFRISNV